MVRPSRHLAIHTVPSSTSSTHAPAMAFLSELTYIYSALTVHDDEVTVTEDKINALIKAAGVNVDTF
ncbi:60S acidic ribosomal protein P1 [Saguinus oedipus]|uniref:60S acidic ribosomal protein P1 n=1 Tax=Saguinus oedipus TaxID=9490 RepID=A0ABQ9WB59_SAGOE|nr:60S acidic ribosomal protein P1 [Saguinus oedipus]